MQLGLLLGVILECIVVFLGTALEHGHEVDVGVVVGIVAGLQHGDDFHTEPFQVVLWLPFVLFDHLEADVPLAVYVQVQGIVVEMHFGRRLRVIRGQRYLGPINSALYWRFLRLKHELVLQQVKALDVGHWLQLKYLGPLSSFHNTFHGLPLPLQSIPIIIHL
jgi:hypothetical protein